MKTTREVSAVASLTLHLTGVSHAHSNAKTLDIEKNAVSRLQLHVSLQSVSYLHKVTHSTLLQLSRAKRIPGRTAELDSPSHHISMPSFPDIFVRITRGVRKKRDLFCLLLVPVKLHFVRHMKVFTFLSSFSLFHRITNLNISPQQDGKCRFINLSLSLEKLQQSS
jgi:hypothetical protein